MNEQIVLTQGDSGIELEVTFIDNKKRVIDLTNMFVEIDIISPTFKLQRRQALVKDAINGVASFIISDKYTNEPELWSTYWRVVDNDNNVTAQESIYYYVKQQFNGNSVTETN